MQPQLRPDDRRIAVVGVSGSGKSTLAARLATRLGVPHVELDAIHHQPGWEPLPRDAVRAAVRPLLDTDGWVLDGNYQHLVGDLREARMQAIVWLDLPRPVIMRQVVARTLRRVLTREELWNGNREPFSNLWAWDPERNIIRWAWTSHARVTARYARLFDDPSLTHVTRIRLRARTDVARFLTTV